ncbi:MAG: ATP-binding protein [Desulfuromonadaceae bacterium]
MPTERDKLIGLGEHSSRKSYYPELQQRLLELERFKALLDSSNDAIFQLEVPSGHIIDANESAGRQLGREREDLLGLSFFEICDLNHSPAAQLINNVENFPEGRLLVETDLYGSDGRHIEVEMTLSRMSFDGAPYVVAVARDISSSRRTEQALSERIQLATLGSEIGNVLTHSSDLRHTLQACATLLVKHTGATFARIWTFNSRAQLLELQASAGIYTQINGKFSRIPPLVKDQDWVRRENIVAFAGYPLIVTDQLVGVMAMFFTQPMNEVILSSLATIANEIANGIKRQKSEDSLRQTLVEMEAARARVDAILRSVADGMLVTDAFNRLTLMNPRAEELLGIRFSDALMNPLETSIPQSALLEQIKNTLAGRTDIPNTILEIPAREQSGSIVLQSHSALVVSESGTVTGVVTLLRDITRERDIDRMKTEFISRAAHELRTPLASVMGYADLLLNKEAYDINDPAQQQEFLSLIWDKGQALSNIIDDLLDLSRIQTGQQTELNLECCNLAELVSRVLQSYRLFSSTHRFELESLKANRELFLDKGKIEQVLENLLSNAVKYSPSGSRILVTAEVCDQTTWISVTDEGVGIAPDQQENIFERFYRIDRSDTAIGGLGLGLAIVKEIIEAHGGKVGLKSTPEQGSCFFVTLPTRL